MKLALLGGTPAIKDDYKEIASTEKVSQEAINKINSMLSKGEISRSPIVPEFEADFSKYIGAKYVLCTCNGTSSLISAMYALEIGPGDEVIVPSFSFWATATCVKTMNGIPVFADIDPNTFNLDPTDIEKKITARTKAIVVVHVYGNPTNMDAIMEIASRNNLKVVEDCSHAHGAKWNGRMVGTIGDIGCFSIQADKLLSAGEGGILVTNNKNYYERAVALGHYEKLQNIPYCDFSKYGLTGMGYKFRPHPLGIAIASENLKRLDILNELRNKNAEDFNLRISDIKCLRQQHVYNKAERQFSYHYVKYIKEEFGGLPLNVVLRALNAEGVETTLCGFGEFHKAPIFKDQPHFANYIPVKENIEYFEPNVTLANSEKIASDIFIALPRLEKECPDLIEQYVNAYLKVFSSLNDLKEYYLKSPEKDLENFYRSDLVKALTKFRKTKSEKH